MTRPKVIGLTGPAGCGKDTVADWLCEQHGFVRYSFAKPLKDMLRAIGVDADNRTTKELPHPMFGVSPRRMAQTLGTEWMRQLVCQDGWLRLAQQFIEASDRNVVCTDCRFENEAWFVRERGGSIWHVTRPDCKPVEAHASENGVGFYSTCDRVLRNDADIPWLHGAIDRMLDL